MVDVVRVELDSDDDVSEVLDVVAVMLDIVVLVSVVCVRVVSEVLVAVTVVVLAVVEDLVVEVMVLLLRVLDDIVDEVVAVVDVVKAHVSKSDPGRNNIGIASFNSATDSLQEKLGRSGISKKSDDVEHRTRFSGVFLPGVNACSKLLIMRPLVSVAVHCALIRVAVPSA
jgi:hypothetical protein